MIEKLTQEQIKQLPVFRDKWLRIGLCTEPANRKKAEEGIKIAYQMADLSPPEKIVWCTSPLANGLAKSIVLKRDSAWSSMGPSMRAFVETSVKASAETSAGSSVGNSLRASVEPFFPASWPTVGCYDCHARDYMMNYVNFFVWKSVWHSVRESVRESVWASVWNSLYASLYTFVRASMRNSVWDFVGRSCNGQHDAYWLGFYDYLNLICNLTRQTKKLEGLWTIAKNAGYFLPHKNICWVSERHNICKLNNRRLIHCDGGPAIQYPDKFSTWALNGVRVSQEIAETPAQELDCKLLAKENNAEVRREIVRKIGIERICKDLKAKVVDTEKDYELLALDLGDRIRPYLKMKNPSIGVYHIEGVHPDCKTVKDAIMFRNGLKQYEPPSKLS